MDDKEKKLSKQIQAYRVGSIILAVLLILAIVFSIIYLRKSGRLSDEKDQLIAQNEQLGIEIERQNESLALKDELIEEGKARIEELNEEHSAILAEKDRRIANLGWRVNTRSKELEEAREENILLLAEKEALEEQQQLLNEEMNDLNQALTELAAEHEDLLQQVEQAKPLKVYNMCIMTKWDRRICADRYNISKAKRVDHTFINFEIDGSLFTETGLKDVYLVMLDPLGDLMYTSADSFTVKDTGEELFYTEKQQINFENQPARVEFNIIHPERLMPGTYMINAYVEGKLSRTKEMVLE